MYNPQQIAEIINAKIVGNTNQWVQYILTDSRQLTESSRSVFIALTSERNDAHQYIFSLHQKGVKTFIVNHVPKNCADLQDVCFLVVDDTLKALQQLAISHRNEFKIPVIGVTG